MPNELPHFINGERVFAAGHHLPIFNPAEGAEIAFAHAASKQTVDQTVAAAKKAFSSWSKTTPTQRAKLLFRFKVLVEQHKDELAAIITREHGKTIVESLGSLQRGIDVLDFACGIVSHLRGAMAKEVAPEMDCYSLHQPLGVCVGITPFNFPAMIALWMFPIALACGNTFILKPSEKDPSCALRLAELAKEAGFPAGTLNLLHGDKDTVDALLLHPDVKAISFVGSSKVAEYVQQRAAMQGKRVQAFGGAKNHCVVMPDANLDEAANALTAAAFGSAGERCMAISVAVTVGDETADQLIKKMQPYMQKLIFGAGDKKETDVGPLITKEHWERVKGYIDAGKKEGATLVVDGSDFKPADAQHGFFMHCSLFDHVKANMSIYRDEIFGPVLCIVRVSSFDEALALINQHEYGNGTAIFTADGYTARRFADEVQAGMVGINVPVPVPAAMQSFGGWKRSNFSDIGMYGPEAIRFYTRLKTVTERWFARTTL